MLLIQTVDSVFTKSYEKVRCVEIRASIRHSYQAFAVEFSFRDFVLEVLIAENTVVFVKLRI